MDEIKEGMLALGLLEMRGLAAMLDSFHRPRSSIAGAALNIFDVFLYIRGIKNQTFNELNEPTNSWALRLCRATELITGSILNLEIDRIEELDAEGSESGE
jgi:hypothetical protein